MQKDDVIYRQVAIDAHCELCGDKGKAGNCDICPDVEVFLSLSPVQPKHLREVTKKMDVISRQAAIDVLNEQIEQCDKALGSFDISMKDEYAVKVERASLVAFRETLEYLPPAQPEIVRCKDCKYWDRTGYCLYGSRLAWKGNDNDYCSRAERREG